MSHYYYHHQFLSQVFFFPLYFCSWASGEPHHSGFKSQLVELSLWCVMFLVWQFFCIESIECCPGIVSRYFCKLLLTIPVDSVITGMTKHFMFHIIWLLLLLFWPTFLRTTRCNIPEDINFEIRHHENLKSHQIVLKFLSAQVTLRTVSADILITIDCISSTDCN
jgi:hypothetical protein